MKKPSLSVLATVTWALLLSTSTPGSAQQLTITPLDPGFPPIVAQYNPKELTLDKSVPWSHRRKSTMDVPTLEFTSAEPKSLSFELLFDTFETSEDVRVKYVRDLEKLALVDTNLKRPPMVLLTWGTGLPPFAGAVENLNVRYTLFLPDGTPVRATCNVRMREASGLTARGGPETTATACAVDGDCPAGQLCKSGFCAPQ